MKKNFLKHFFMLLMALLVAVPSMDAKKKLHTIGDSTMDGSYDPATTYKRGWCMMLQQFFNSDNIQVNNRGKSGASSKSFYKESAYWPTLVKGGSDQMQEGDILIIQFAHNDEKNGGADGDVAQAYYDSGHENEFIDTKTGLPVRPDYRGTTASGTYKEYIRKYINEAKAMGVKPIVVGAICRKYFGSDGKIRRNGRHDLGDSFDVCDGKTYTKGNKVATTDHTHDYPYQSSLVAAEYKDVPYIDLTGLTAELYQSYGDAYCTSALFGPDDSTHPAALGATLIARTFAQGVKALYESEEYAKAENAEKKAVLKELYDELVLSNDISFNPTSGELGEAYVGKAAKKEFNISAFGLAQSEGKVTISVTDGFELSVDGNNWVKSTEVSYTGSTLITSVFVRAMISAVGTTAGKLTVDDGKNQKSLDISATGKSLVQGDEATCEWIMNTASTTPTSELLNAKEATYSGMVLNGNLATPTSPEGHSKMAMFTTTDGAWPAGEIDEQSGRYVQFQVTVPEGKTLYLDNISYEVGAWGGNGMCYHAYYATKSDFSNQVFMDEKKNIANKSASTVEKESNATIEEGESLYIRFYPWYNGAATGKYLAISNLKVHGILASAGGVNISGSITREFVGAKDEAKYTPEELGAGFASIKTEVGADLYESSTVKWTGTTDNNKLLTNFQTANNIVTKGSPDASNTVTFTFTPADGYTFMPSKLSLRGAKFGTNGGKWYITVSAGSTSETIVSNADVNRGANNVALATLGGDIQNVVANADAPLKVAVSVCSFGTTTSGSKNFGIGDLVIEGTITGAAATGTKYEITKTVSPAEAGTIEADPDQESIKEGKDVTLTAKKNFGYKFQKWTVNGSDYSTDATTTIKMDEAKDVVAVFETVPVYTVDALVKNDLDMPIGAVTLTPNDHQGKYEEGTEVTVKAETSKILKFMNWEDNSTVNPRSITVDKDITVTANYEIQDFIAVFDDSKNGDIYAYPSTTGYPYNADLSWDEGRNAKCAVVKVSDGSLLYTNDGKTVGSSGTPVVRYRNGVVLAGINGLYQNGYNTADIAWQYQFSTKGFTSAKFVGDMAAKNMADAKYKAQYSLDGTNFTDITSWPVTANLICPIEFALPAEAVGQDMVYVRITGTGESQLSSTYSYEPNPFLGLKYYSHSESGVGNVFILGEAETVADEIAPKLSSTIPVANATGIPASGNIVITFDEKIQLSNKVNGFATLNGEKLNPVTSAKSVSFQYVNLEYGKTYTFSMPAGFVEDKSGNAADAVELTFTIMERIKPTARIFDAVVDKTLDLKYGESIAATETMPKQCRYIQDAINDAPEASTKPYLIYIKEGYYDDANPYFNDSYGQCYDLTKPDGKGAYEVINNSVNGNGTMKDGGKRVDDCKLIFINKPNVHLIGQATDKVTIATDRMDGGDASRPEKVWYHVNAGAAVEIQKGADDALLSTLTIDNENWTKDKKAGPQALCLNTDADRCVYNELNIQSYQDDYKCAGTYNRAFWFKSRFEGSVDYIYGDCDVWFEECIQDINRDKGGYIVAPSHPLETRWGYVFNNNTIKSSLYGSDCQVWLGRPWHNMPKTVFMNTKVEVKTYDGYWAENMGGLPAIWAVKNLTDKNGIALSEESRSSYYADQPDGHFPEGTYTSKVDLGTGKFRYTNANTKNSLTDEEFAQYTVQNVLAGDKSTNPSGYWNPLTQVEKTATPAVTVNGNIAQWTADEYAICYVVTVNGKPSAFVTDAQYVGEEGDKVTVQSVNENGILSAMSTEVTLEAATAVIAVPTSATNANANGGIYTIDGKKVISKVKGNIYVEDGQKIAY
ncbi:MAG: Ig-like domain-containing protein [Prevotella sp.]|nr:Ig-like domain-containing protein [Candidatus Prevotella equi]